MIKTWFIAVLKYVPPLSLIGITVMIIYGLVSPWEISKDILSNYENSAALLVGLNKESGTYSGRQFNRQSRSYIVIDKNLNSKSVTVYAESDKFQNVKEEEGGLIMLVFTYLVLVILTWYFWVKPHNKSLNHGTPQSGAP